MIACVLPGCEGMAQTPSPYCCPKCASLDAGRKYATAEGQHFSNGSFFQLNSPPPMGLFLSDRASMQSSPILPSRKQPVSALYTQEQQSQHEVKTNRREGPATLTQLFGTRAERAGSTHKTPRINNDEDDDVDDDIVSEDDGAVLKGMFKSTTEGEDVWLTCASPTGRGAPKKSRSKSCGPTQLTLANPSDAKAAKQQALAKSNSTATKQLKLKFEPKRK